MSPGVAIAVVGMGAVFPGAPDLATYRANIRAGVDAITDVPSSRWDEEYYDPVAAKTRPGDRMYCRRGGFVTAPDFDPVRFGIMPLAVADIEADQLIALLTAAAAIEDAGGPGRLGDRAKVGIVLGRGGYFNPGMARFVDRVRTANQLALTLRELLPDLSEAQAEAIRAGFADRLGPMREESGIEAMVPNLVASRTANRLDLAGPAYTVDAACASSLIAVDHAVRELTSGRCDVVLAGGVHHCHDITFWSGFNLLGALSHSERIRPFHRGADGILIGEGTGIVVLKRLADTAGDRVYAVIRGTGVAGDGRSASLMAPQSSGQVKAMEQAWAAAGLDPTEPGSLGLLEAHGTATTAGDATEIASLTEVFGPRRPDRAGPDIGLGSVKSMIGHAMPAAGVAGLIKAVLAVHDGVLPPTLHCEDPHPALEGTRFAPVTLARDWPGPGPRRAAVNAFGFGGINAHVVLEQAPDSGQAGPPAGPPTGTAGRVAAGAHRPIGQGGTAQAPDPAGERVLLLAGADAGELARALEAPDADLLARDDSSDVPAAGPARLAIVGADPKRLALARKILAQGKPWRGRSDVWFTAEPLLAPGPGDGGGPRVAFLFPGVEQTFEPRVDDVAAHFGLPPVRRSGGAGLGRRGLELAGVGRLLERALRTLGISPDVVAGHSIGEWSALIASGAATFEAFASSTRAFDAGPGVPDLVFAALGCGAEAAAAAIEGLADVVVSHDNCPHQSIICGGAEQVEVALERLRATGTTGAVLPFRSGFHTPMLAPYLGPTRAYVAELELRPATVPLWSATTVGPYPTDPAEIRELLLRNLVEPVRFGPLVRRLHAAGVRAFLQVGTGSLPGFVEDTLDDPATPHLVMSVNVTKRTGLQQLRRVAAAMWAEGAAPRFDRLLPAAGPPAPDPPAPPPTPAPAARPGVTVALGAPLVHLEGAAAAISPAATAPSPLPWAVPPMPADPDPVLAEFHGLLAETAQAAAAVIGAWRPDLPAARVPAPPAPAGPRSRTTHRVMSLRTDPYLADHCLLRAPEGRSGTADLFPIVPMTGAIEMIVDAAAGLVPERRVIGVRGMRALRPLAVEPEITLIIEATEKPGDGDLSVVRVVVDGRIGSGPRESYARATVLLADGYPVPPALREVPLTSERPSEVDAQTLYTDRWMFHGPAYRGVVELSSIADDGVRGTLVALPAPGALLDAAGQLLGYWIGLQPANRLVLPATIGSVSFYGPDPEAGSRLGAVVHVRSATDDEAVADLELRDAAGRLWCHITGWTDRRLETDDATVTAFRHPDRSLLARPQDGGWVLLAEPWSDPVARELCMRQYLDAAERDAHATRNPRAARQWLLGRIAAKDAVRAHLWAAGAGPIYPAEVVVGNDPSGRPYAAGAGSDALALSLAHSGPLAVAVVGPAGPLPAAGVGIDVELVDDAPAEAALLTPPERVLLDTLCPGTDARARAVWVTRFWTAKEAVAKAAGTGLEGRPGRFVVVRVEDDRLLVSNEGTNRWVTTRSGDEPVPYAVGWTLAVDYLGADDLR